MVARQRRGRDIVVAVVVVVKVAFVVVILDVVFLLLLILKQTPQCMVGYTRSPPHSGLVVQANNMTTNKEDYDETSQKN